jgi:lipoate synthase
MNVERNERLAFSPDTQHGILLQMCTWRVFEHCEEESLRQACSLKARNEPMDKNEAERLAKAICKVQMDWIKVDGVAYNHTTDQYEVQCEYQQEDQGQVHSKETWTTLQIKSPRQWIDLLTQHGGGLELP